MRIIKTIISNIHRYILWALVSFILWAWICTLLTDTSRGKKVVLYVNTPVCSDRQLEAKLSENLPDGIRMIKVHPFDYAAFGSGDIENSDLIIMPEIEMESKLPLLCPIPADGTDTLDVPEGSYISGGNVYGILLYDAACGDGALMEYLTYTQPGAEAENYYLCFTASSPHLGEWNGSANSAAIIVAIKLLRLP